ncbi:MAG: TRAP transporter substrate-binding protein DctP, partial [Oscillospiraceae bacterium]|nr:TRAP transporter substrate-binding protein DctP [Oscillospiraceae bacterium]
SVIPQVACLSIPGYFSGTEEEWLEFAAALEGPMTELLAQYDLKYMGADYPGVAAFYGTGDPLTSPEACKGKVIRSAGEYLSKSIEAWGAAATTIPMPDIASSIERGTVDACYTMYAMLNDQGFKDLVDWAVYTTNQETFSAMIMSLDTYEDMTPAQKAVIDEAVKVYPKMSMDDYDYPALVQGVKDAGVNVVELTAEESAAFTEATRPLFEEFGKNTDEYGLAILKVIYDFNGWEWTF